MSRWCVTIHSLKVASLVLVAVENLKDLRGGLAAQPSRHRSLLRAFTASYGANGPSLALECDSVCNRGEHCVESKLRLWVGQMQSAAACPRFMRCGVPVWVFVQGLASGGVTSGD